MDWVKSLNQAIDYIEDNLTDNIGIGDIASHIYLSNFHFQRVFSLLTGLTVGEYIRNRRLSRAGQDLLSGKEKVIDIALKYCYETPEGFTKAFARYHGVTPSEVKKPGTVLKSFQRLVLKITLEGGSSMEFKIEAMDAFEVVLKTRTFQDETSSKEVPKFWTEYFEKGYEDNVVGMFGICIEQQKNGNAWRYGIGALKELVKAIPEDFEVLTIPAHTWAKFTCIGAMPNAIQKLWMDVYSQWLPASAYDLIPDYAIEYYTDGDASKDDYVSEVWIPVKAK